MNMKFIKGIIVGSLISAGVAMACSENMETGKKKIVKMGKQFAKKMGIV